MAKEYFFEVMLKLIALHNPVMNCYITSDITMHNRKVISNAPSRGAVN